jgi:hypothetical protein
MRLVVHRRVIRSGRFGFVLVRQLADMMALAGEEED